MDINTPGTYKIKYTVKDKTGKEVQLPKEQQDYTMKYVKKLPYAVEQIKQCYSKEEYMQYLVDCCKASGSNLLMLEQMILAHIVIGILLERQNFLYILLALQ